MIRLTIAALFVWAVEASGALETNVFMLERFDTLAAWQVGGNKETTIVSNKSDEVFLEWRSQARGGTTLVKDLTAGKNRLAGYDAICFEYWRDGDLSQGSLMLENVPGYSRARDWYFKFPARIDREWHTARFELTRDDDSPENGKDPRTLAHFEFSTQSRTITTQSVWRIRNLRAVRYPVRVDYDEAKKTFAETADAFHYTYELEIRSSDDADRDCALVFDRSKLKHFTLESPPEPITVKKGGRKTVAVTLAISKDKARGLPPLYTEFVPFVLRVQGLEESNVPVLRGWQEVPLVATVPPRYAGAGRPRVRCDPAHFAHLRERVKTEPAFTNALAWFRQVADQAVAQPRIYPKTAGGHVMGFECPDCKGPLQVVSETAQYCPKCKKQITGHPELNARGVVLTHLKNADDAYCAALVYALTGEKKYRDLAREILLTYARMAPKMAEVDPHATAYSNIIGGSMLMESYAKGFPWAYDFLMAGGGLTESEARTIEDTFLLPMLRRMFLHHTGYSSQTSEYVSQQVACALACGHWSLAGRALYGDFGLFDMIRNAFDDSGWARENYMDIQSTQSLTTIPLVTAAEAACIAGIDAYGDRKLQTIFRNTRLDAVLSLRNAVGGPAAPSSPRAVAHYPESQVWFFAAP